MTRDVCARGNETGFPRTKSGHADKEEQNRVNCRSVAASQSRYCKQKARPASLQRSRTTQQTSCRWRKECGGSKQDQTKRLTAGGRIVVGEANPEGRGQRKLLTPERQRDPVRHAHEVYQLLEWTVRLAEGTGPSFLLPYDVPSHSVSQSPALCYCQL